MRTLYDLALRRTKGQVAPDPDGSGPAKPTATRYLYDTAGRLQRTERGVVDGPADSQWSTFQPSSRQENVYDSYGRIVQSRTIGDGTTAGLTETSYDSAGRIDCVAQRMNAATLNEGYADACTAKAAGSDGPDRITRTSYDVVNRQVSVTSGYGRTEALTQTVHFNANGQQDWVRDGENNRTSYAYDGLARLKRTSYPVGTRGADASSTSDYEELGYDAAGNVTSRRLRNGQSLGFTYDALGRITKKTVPDGCAPGQSTGCPPASATRDVDYGYDLLGHLTSATFSGTSEAVSATYDALGRMASTTTTMGGTTRTLSYAYDAAGNRTKLTYPDGMAFGYERDALGRNTRITETVGATTREVLNLAYYADGTLSWFGHGANGRGHGYDKLGRLTGYNLQRNENGTVVLDGTVLEYNPASQIRRQYRTNDDYAWTGAVNVDRPYTTNGLNQYSAAGPATFEYDKNGNLTKSVSPAGGTQVYGYDAENRLVSGPNGVALIYDPLGRLFEIAQNGTVASRFVYDGDALVLEYDGAGNRLQRHVHLDGADTPVLSYHASETSPRQLMPDHQGSIVSMTQHGWSRIVVNTYDEYGYPGTNNTGRFQYTGQAWLAELGLYYYKARMYSPGMGRFLQTDPIGYGDGLNWYDYVGGDPVNKTDPSGLAQFCYPDPSVTVGSVQSGSYRREFTPRIICQWFDDPTRGQIMPSTPSINPGRGTQSECHTRACIQDKYRKARSKTRKISQCMQGWLTDHYVGFDCNLPTISSDDPLPGAAASTDSNLNVHVGPSKIGNIERNSSLFFHEIAHFPQWVSGSLTTLGYIGSAIQNFGVHDNIPVEIQADTISRFLTEAYKKDGNPCG